MTLQEQIESGLFHHRAGRLREAESVYRQILSQRPDCAEALHLLGVLSAQMGKRGEAVELIRRAVQLKPDFAEAQNDLGVVLKEIGQLDEAVTVGRRAIQIKPDYAQAHYNLGIALKELGRFEEAIASYRQAIRFKPDFANAYNNLGIALADTGHIDEAVASYRHAIRLQPNDAEMHYNLGNAFKANDQFDESIGCYRNAICLKSDHAQAFNNLGNVHDKKGQFDQSVAAYREAIRIKPDYAESHYNLGSAFLSIGKLEEAIAAFRRAIELRPNFAEACNNLANALRDAGLIEEAIASYRQAIRLKPDHAIAHSNLLFAMNYHSGNDARLIDGELRRWRVRFADPFGKSILPHANSRRVDRRLRIGYVSADFRNHPVGRFVLPLLRHHHHDAYEVICYSDVVKDDAITEKLRACADRYENIARLSDEQVAEKVREDKIDILVDLSGHTAGNRLLVFARKPAPVQISYLGYPGSTGLPVMDYRLTDALADPEDKMESPHDEKLLRLPVCNWCFGEPDDSPPVRALPAGAGGSVCFGSFNNFAKVSPDVLELWAGILKAMPSSRLMVKSRGLGEPSVRGRINRYFASRGIDAERLELRGHEPDVISHLEAYNCVDIALDTFPYHGTMTTCEALWMGVPVVTLAGSTHVSRVGVSLLRCAGLPELIAPSADEYVSIAIGLANDLPRLAELRSGLRRRMEADLLMDAPRFACDIEAAYRQAWRAWCLG